MSKSLTTKSDRALAHVEKIAWVKPIEGADNIELVGILGWMCIAKIGEFKVGDWCVYIEIDSLCPEAEWSEFLRNKKFKVKTMKLSRFGVISQGLALPINAFNGIDIPQIEGSDVTDLLGITYYVPDDNIRKAKDVDDLQELIDKHPAIFKYKLARWIANSVLGRALLSKIITGNDDDNKFPKQYKYIHKTDETRCENIPWILNSKEPWVVTTKIDGTSATYILKRVRNIFRKDSFKFYVYSRNIKQFKPNDNDEKNVYWEAAIKYDIENKLKEIMASPLFYDSSYLCLQGEIAGVGVQGNPHKFNDLRFFGFNFIDSVGGRWGSIESECLFAKYNIPWVPIVDTKYYLPDSMEELKAHADGDCEAEGASGLREGYVYRSYDGQRSFKNVSNKYLLKYK